MFKVSIEDKISAAHHLRGYDGKCAEPHGHNWKVIVRVMVEKLNNIGLAIDFYDLRSITKSVVDKLDHKDLNELEYFSDRNPSSENIARFLYENIQKQLPEDVRLEEVEVVESEGSTVTYSE